jgi:Asp-tRNA(Asn)/Glu-tRNA(Gln) amidotransferase C subunit
MKVSTEDGEQLSDKEVVKLGSGENSAPASTSEGEYSEDRKASLAAMQGYYGEETSPDSEDYTPKLEKMVSSDLIPKANKLKSYDEANYKLIAMIEDNPEMGSILSDMSKGAKFLHVLPKYVDFNNLPQEQTDTAEWEKNSRIREDNYRKKLDREQELASNEEKSTDTVLEFVKEKALEGEDAEAFGRKLIEFLDRAYSGEITKDFLEAMYFYLNRDKELARERNLGELAGRNAKIEESMMNEKDYVGDSLPSISGGSSSTDTPKEVDRTDPRIKDLSAYLDNNKPIIDRG